jgi:hypothetical protein
LHGEKNIILLFVETPRKFIAAVINDYAVINLRGVSTNNNIKLVLLVQEET